MTISYCIKDPRSKDLQIHMTTHTGTTITVDKENFPLVHGVYDRPGYIQVTATFKLDQDYSADEVTLNFKGVYGSKIEFEAGGWFDSAVISEEVFATKQWSLPIERGDAPRTIAKGFYERQVAVMIDPAWPSSLQSPSAWIRYEFKLHVSKHCDLAAPGSQLPVNVRVGSFSRGSKNVGRAAVVLGATFTFVEHRVLRSSQRDRVVQNDAEIMTISLKTGWTNAVEGWERTVGLTIPRSPVWTADCKSKYLHVSHSLTLDLKVKSDSMRDFRAESVQLHVDFHAMMSRPSVENNPALPPPAYENVEQHEDEHGNDHPVGDSTSMLLEDDLPTYARVEE
ncbi:hypothetical protein BGX23_003382 [Mortierella sp. AD031]|nr:hypothetical protein BGX23_003382 [Mortierella sp. AD031]KAG0216126.1 hypothetical protein BGX33_000463 [Mortierella sp. NVP41]